MHLHVVITNKCVDNSFLFVSITTIYPDKSHDSACVFSGGEHDFIEHPSYVDYSKAQMRFNDALQRCLDTGLFPSKPDMEGPHFQRVCDGVAVSVRCKPWAKKMFAANLPY